MRFLRLLNVLLLAAAKYFRRDQPSVQVLVSCGLQGWGRLIVSVAWLVQQR